MTFRQILLCFLVFIVLFFNSCKENVDLDYIPEKDLSLSTGEYENYRSKLIEAYSSKNFINAALQIANLNGEKEKAFEILEYGIRNREVDCHKIYDWYYMYDKHDFGMNLVKMDTSKFKNSVRLCDLSFQDYSYLKYALDRKREEEEFERNRPIEDSTNFDMELVFKLSRINHDDQYLRKVAAKKGTSQKTKDSLFQEIKILDSINLEKVDEILSVYGYPGVDLVGKECSFVPALVIHHCSDLERRYKYLPLLEEAVNLGRLGEGTLEMIKRRNRQMELTRQE